MEGREASSAGCGLSLLVSCGGGGGKEGCLAAARGQTGRSGEEIADLGSGLFCAGWEVYMGTGDRRESVVPPTVSRCCRWPRAMSRPLGRRYREAQTPSRRARCAAWTYAVQPPLDSPS